MGSVNLRALAGAAWNGDFIYPFDLISLQGGLFTLILYCTAADHIFVCPHLFPNLFHFCSWHTYAGDHLIPYISWDWKCWLALNSLYSVKRTCKDSMIFLYTGTSSMVQTILTY